MKRSLLTLAILAIALAGASSAPAQVNRYLLDTGPLRIRDQFLLGMGFLQFDPVSADVLERGRWQLDVVLTETNTFAHSDSVERFLKRRSEREPITLEQLRTIQPDSGSRGIFLLDGELYRTAIAARRGLGHGVQIEITLPILSFQGGTFDSVVESFHDAFGFGQFGRTGVPKDQFLVYARSGDHEVFRNDDPSAAIGDIVLGVKVDLLRQTTKPWELALETLVKLPTGDEGRLTSSGETDVGVQALATRYYAKSCLHGSLGLLYVSGWDFLGTDDQALLSGMLAYERALGPKMTWLIQGTASQSPFRDLGIDEISQASYQITGGFKRVVRGGNVLFFGLTENVGTFNVGPDIGLHIGVTKTFEPKRKSGDT